MGERRWNSEAQMWVHDSDIQEALDAAQLAISEYYNGDRGWAEAWLVKAREANQGGQGCRKEI